MWVECRICHTQKSFSNNILSLLLSLLNISVWTVWNLWEGLRGQKAWSGTWYLIRIIIFVNHFNNIYLLVSLLLIFYFYHRYISLYKKSNQISGVSRRVRKELIFKFSGRYWGGNSCSSSQWSISQHNIKKEEKIGLLSMGGEISLLCSLISNNITSHSSEF